jgi:hypothetical protein
VKTNIQNDSWWPAAPPLLFFLLYFETTILWVRCSIWCHPNSPN